ncbi:threonine/serine dehydratase [Kitasatospora purpeofusca]|uniref:threonine/serine dehydratase n=1 Tax=Kitasatospora purpeofusca TaxID=67352 RepID=UPI002A5A8D43|nr:threonine/serine dehydratase [Kitasatospora purpeofusca]MDY0816627.1 threonine/serine dehydratase [Kitasatospora purpeofusca]
MRQQLGYEDIKAAAERIAGHVRPVAVAPAEGLAAAGSREGAELWLALEYLQHTGSFKARGAQNFLRAHREAGTLPDAGVTIASGGNAGLACAWAALREGVRATVFLPANAPQVKVARLRSYGADVRLVGTEYAEALAACEEFAATGGALASHAYDHPLIAAGAGTLMEEIHARVPGLDTVLVAVGGGGLFAGVATAARQHGIRAVAVEPEHSRALHAALAAGRPVDVTVDSVAGDSLGARRATALAVDAARPEGGTTGARSEGGTTGARSVLVPDEAIVRARRELWEDRRILVEHGAATALAALLTDGGGTEGADSTDRANSTDSTDSTYGYRPADGEKVCVVLCGANTDPATLRTPPDPR